MRELRSYGSVGEPVGNPRLYPEDSGRLEGGQGRKPKAEILNPKEGRNAKSEDGLLRRAAALPGRLRLRFGLRSSALGLLLPSPLRRLQRLVNVGFDVFHVLDADGKPHIVRRHPCRGLLRGA